MINNIRIYGGEFDITPVTLTDDGRLDAVVFRSRRDYFYNFARAYRRLPAFLKPNRQTPGPNQSHYRQARSIVIKLTEPTPPQIDGELFAPSDSFKIGIAPKAVTVRTPGTE